MLFAEQPNAIRASAIRPLLRRKSNQSKKNSQAKKNASKAIRSGNRENLKKNHPRKQIKF